MPGQVYGTTILFQTKFYLCKRINLLMAYCAETINSLENSMKSEINSMYTV